MTKKYSQQVKISVVSSLMTTRMKNSTKGIILTQHIHLLMCKALKFGVFNVFESLFCLPMLHLFLIYFKM